MGDSMEFSVTNGNYREGERPSDHQPNVLWVFMDDVNPWMGTYGHDVVETPNIDSLAENGVRFDRLYSTAPVCTPSRSAVITGMYQTTIGAHNHYSSFESWRDVEFDVWDPTHLGVRTIPEMFRSAGYYTFNEGKNHYNFVDRNDMLYDRKGEESAFQGATEGTEWSGRDSDQPFFGQIQLNGGKADVDEDIQRVDPDDVDVPPYYPDHPVYREEIAHHYDCIQQMDRDLGEILGALRADRLYDLRADPHETENLVHSSEREHQTVLGRLRTTLNRWIVETDDQGRVPESDAALRAVVDRWGDQAVDPVYDRVRDGESEG